MPTEPQPFPTPECCDAILRRASPGADDLWELLALLSKRMWATAYQHLPPDLRSPEAAEELVCQFIATKGRGLVTGFKRGEPFGAYILVSFHLFLKRAVPNEVKRYRRLMSFETADQYELVVEQTDPIVDIIDNEEKRLLSLRINAALDRLAPSYREVVILHYFEERSCEQIAAQLQASVTAIKVRLCRARKQLGAMLEQDGTAK